MYLHKYGEIDIRQRVEAHGKNKEDCSLIEVFCIFLLLRYNIPMGASFSPPSFSSPVCLPEFFVKPDCLPSGYLDFFVVIENSPPGQLAGFMETLDSTKHVFYVKKRESKIEGFSLWLNA